MIARAATRMRGLGHAAATRAHPGCYEPVYAIEGECGRTPRCFGAGIWFALFRTVGKEDRP